MSNMAVRLRSGMNYIYDTVILDKKSTHFCGKYWLGKDISSNITKMIVDDDFIPYIGRPEQTVEDERDSKIDKDVKRAENLLSNLDKVNNQIWTSYISDDIPVPIPDFKVKQFLEDSQKDKLHWRLEKIAKHMSKDIKEQTFDKVYDYDHNPWWQHLTLPDDRQLLTECPHFGQWTDGRSHSRFHSLPSLKKVEKRDSKKVYREDILLCGEKMEELFDIPHAFPLLLFYILNGNDKVEKDELQRYQDEVWILDRADDIYCHILKDAGFNPFEQIEIRGEDGKKKISTHRDEVKKVVQMWIYSDNAKKNFMKWNVQYYDAVCSYYEKNYPTISQALYDWPVEMKNYIDESFTIKTKGVRAICHDFQKLERKVSVGLCSLLDCPYQPLYDAIYVRKSDIEFLRGSIDFTAEMKKILEK